MKCFKCEKELVSAVVDGDPWEFPSGGVLFAGGWNFGSELYDAMIDGIYVDIAICDDCLKVAKGDDRMREMRKVEVPDKKEVVG